MSSPGSPQKLDFLHLKQQSDLLFCKNWIRANPQNAFAALGRCPDQKVSTDSYQSIEVVAVGDLEWERWCTSICTLLAGTVSDDWQCIAMAAHVTPLQNMLISRRCTQFTLAIVLICMHACQKQTLL